jgi:hypothetical protein
MIAGYEKSILPVYDNFGVCPDRAGNWDAPSAHGIDKCHPERFLASLEVDAETATLHFTRQLTLPDDTMISDPWLRQRILTSFPP